MWEQGIELLHGVLKQIFPHDGWTLQKIASEDSTTQPVDKPRLQLYLAEDGKHPDAVDHDDGAVVGIGIFPDLASEERHIHEANDQQQVEEKVGTYEHTHLAGVDACLAVADGIAYRIEQQEVGEVLAFHQTHVTLGDIADVNAHKRQYRQQVDALHTSDGVEILIDDRREEKEIKIGVEIPLGIKPEYEDTLQQILRPPP